PVQERPALTAAVPSRPAIRPPGPARRRRPRSTSHREGGSGSSATRSTAPPSGLFTAPLAHWHQPMGPLLSCSLALGVRGGQRACGNRYQLSAGPCVAIFDVTPPVTARSSSGLHVTASVARYHGSARTCRVNRQVNGTAHFWPPDTLWTDRSPAS